MAGVYSLDELRALIAPLPSRYHASGASPFGSYARGEATPDSDLDVVVRGGADFDPTDVLAIAEDLHEASGKRVDVYEECEIRTDTPLHRSIEAEGLVLA